MIGDSTVKDRFNKQPPRTRAVPRAVTLALALLFLVIVTLRNDFWNWNTPRPLLFGFLPVGLWWQALVSILASMMMGLMVRWAWPHELERLAEHHDNPGAPEQR